MSTNFITSMTTYCPS